MEWFNSFLTALLTALTSVQPAYIPLAILLLVSGAFILFIWKYVSPARRIIRNLKTQTKILSDLKPASAAEKFTRLGEIFGPTSLAHAWSEFSESLHQQKERVEGEARVKNVRATAPAAAFFTEQQVVDIPINTEFFKHLPGILTGIGIIGTFYGLMIGLNHFDPGTPEQVSRSVAALLRDVLYAFLGSFTAILISILVTWLEKFYIAKCYKHLEQFTASVDQLFETGVGEEYLADLVDSSNENVTQAKQLKDSLVTDLRDMMKLLVDSQVAENEKLAHTLSSTYRDTGQQFAEQVSGAIENSLKSPLDKIAGAVQTASGDQSGQVQNMLQDVLTAFMSKLDNTFGKQFENMHQMMGQSVGAIEAMQTGFAGLLQDMRHASEDTRQGSAELMSQLLSEMKAGQLFLPSPNVSKRLPRFVS